MPETGAGFVAEDLGAPMDVLWFRLPKPPTSKGELFGVVGAGAAVVLIDRIDYFQVAYVLPKGSQRARAGTFRGRRTG